MHNINFLRQYLKQIENDTLDELSEITKAIGSQVLNLYDEAAIGINDNKTENLAKQVEIENLIQENNNLRHQISVLLVSVEKMENFLGVKPSDKFTLNK